MISVSVYTRKVIKPFGKFKITKISILTEIGDFGVRDGLYWRKAKFFVWRN